MDYSKLSDFEINKLVARAIDGIDVDDDVTAIDCYLTANKSNCVKWYKLDFDDPKEFELFNPCNNPSDAWPIIVDNTISIENRKNKTALAWIGNDAPYPDDNPLRAAMIAYLMMQEQ